MDKALNISSEEELLQLRNEGKISEAEYEELRETLQKTTKVDIGEGCKDNLKPTRTSGLAIASLVLSLIGPVCCIPAIVCGHIALRKIRKEAAVKGYGLALAGLIIGYIGLGLLIVLATLILILYGWRAQSYNTRKEIALAELQHATIEIATGELKHYPLDSMEGILDQDKVTLDKQISSDGDGSLRIESTETTHIRLFETGDIDIEDARLIYQARVRTENVEGQVYQEIRCRFSSPGFPGIAESFSKGLMNSLSGTTDWTTQETPFLLQKGENPDNVKLNLVIEGKGTVWIDDIRLVKGRLKN
jgi:hypothetical protein